VSAGRHPGRQRRLLQRDLRDVRVAAVTILETALLPVDTPALAVSARDVAGPVHARHAALAGAEERDLRAEGVFVDIVFRFPHGVGTRHAQAAHRRERAVRDAVVVGVAVRRVPLRRQADAPALIGVDRLTRRRVMVVLALGIHQLAETARLVDLAHGVTVRAEGRGFVQAVHQPGLLDRVQQLVGQLELVVAEHGRHGRGHVQPALQARDAEARVTRRVCSNVDRLDLFVLLVHLLAGGVGFFRAHFFRQFRTTVGEEIAGSHHLHVRMVLITEVRAELTDAISHDADLDLAVGDRLPRLFADLARVGLAKTCDLGRRLRLRPRCGSGESRCADRSPPEKSPSRERIHSLSLF